MAQFSARFKKAFLRNLWESAPEGATTLSDALTAASRSHIQTLADGFLIQNVSGASHSTGIFVPSTAYNGNKITPDEFADLCEELIERFTWAGDLLSSTDEATIYARMLVDMPLQPPGGPVTSHGCDYSLLRCV